MDHQAFFRKDQANFLDAWRQSVQSNPPHEDPCFYLQFLHFNDPKRLEVKHGQVTNADVIQWAQQGSQAKADAQSRILLGPAGPQPLPLKSGLNGFDPKSLLPFEPEIAQTLAAVVHLHAAGFTEIEHAETAKFRTPTGLTSMYVESTCHRACWFALFVVFDPTTCTSTTILNNILPDERELVQERLQESGLTSLSLHPLLVPTLVIEMLVREVDQHLGHLNTDTVRLSVIADLIDHDRYGNYDGKKGSPDPEQLAEETLQYEQRALIMLEKMESIIKIATTLLSWVPDFSPRSLEPDLQSRFRVAGEIIQNRLQQLVDTLEFQTRRVKRTQEHAQLNRLGLQLRNTTIGNKLSTEISQQSRNIAREAKRDSSAMKAIAVLTMFFLPGTFFAAFFAMPLFDWSSTSLVTGKFWVYWAVTVPATILVLVVWRIWYEFDEWRHRLEKKESAFRDFWAWFRTNLGPKGKMKDLESGKTLEEI